MGGTPLLSPYKTILVLKCNGREVGRIPAIADNVNNYIQAMASLYGELQIDYVPDKTGGLLAMLH